jgi:arabinofuranosyltransferase
MALAIGVGCHLLYVVRVGGDFMSGRFLTPALVMAVGILGTIDWRRGVVPMAILLLFFYNFIQPFAPCWTRGTYSNTEIDSAGIADERGFYFQHSSIWRYVESVQAGTLFPKISWVDDAVELARSNYKATVMPAIGYFGYYVRLDQIVIDPMALSDPLLARLPARSAWRIGHMVRDIPEGYLESIVSGQNSIKDPAVRELYNKLELVTKGPLFTAERWRTIWALNGGW